MKCFTLIGECTDTALYTLSYVTDKTKKHGVEYGYIQYLLNLDLGKNSVFRLAKEYFEIWLIIILF